MIDPTRVSRRVARWLSAAAEAVDPDERGSDAGDDGDDPGPSGGSAGDGPPQDRSGPTRTAADPGGRGSTGGEDPGGRGSFDPAAALRGVGVTLLGGALAARDLFRGRAADGNRGTAGATGSGADPAGPGEGGIDVAEPVVVEDERSGGPDQDPTDVDSLYAAVVDPLPREPRPDGGRRVVAAPDWPDPATDPRVESRAAGPDAPGETVAERVSEVLYEEGDAGEEWAEQLEFVEVES